MPRPIIEIKGISKKYNIMHERGYLTLRDTIASYFKKPLNLLRYGKSRNSSVEAFWALKDVSFDVKQGEVIGIIGRNGAGKTTLLKILCRITHPTEGGVRLCGRVSSLLEVGTGFHAELTGRENIFFNGAILGMKRQEVKKKFDEIVDFSGIEKFIDIPAKRYSAGMYVRLAFAVAAHLESEILLVDEVLAVGDVAFQKKCIGKMNDLTNKGRTVLFVSHNMGAAINLCSSGVLLNEGRIACKGAISDVVNYYIRESDELSSESRLLENRKGLSSEFRFRAVRVYGIGGKKTSKVLLSEGFKIEIEYEILHEIQGAQIEFVLHNSKNECIFMSTDVDHYSVFADSVRGPGRYITSCYVPSDYLRIDRYRIDVSAMIPRVRKLDYIDKPIPIEVIDDREKASKIMIADRQGVIAPLLKWKTQKV